LLSGAVILTLFYVFKAQIDVLNDGSIAGGISGCVGYAGFVLVVSFLGDMSREKTLWYLLASVGTVAAALLVNAFLVPADYAEYNASYMIKSLFVMNTIYLFFYALDKLLIKNRPIPVLAGLGRSLLIFFLLSWQIASILESVLNSVVKDGVGTIGILIGVELVGFALYVAVGFILYKKKIIIKI
jgi:hypothetical protein